MEILAMKRPQLLYWSVTGVMAAFMLMASIPDILRIPQAVEVFTHLGYPTYLLPFLGIAKTLAVITILAPSFLWLKEWAYAGLIFDLIGAFYSHLAVGDPPSAWMFPVDRAVLGERVIPCASNATDRRRATVGASHSQWTRLAEQERNAMAVHIIFLRNEFTPSYQLPMNG
jgi:DoxX-like family